jgi:hypothetical protein
MLRYRHCWSIPSPAVPLRTPGTQRANGGWSAPLAMIQIDDRLQVNRPDLQSM